MAKYSPVDVAYLEFNPTSGADESLSPVIFLHGLSGCKEMWEDIPQIIADKSKRKVYTIDARDHGDSPRTEIFSFELNVDDLLHFMDNKNIKKAVLIGHSMGSFTVTNTALRSPDRVEKMFSEDMYVKKLSQEVLDGVIVFQKLWVKSIQNIPRNSTEEEAWKLAVDSIFTCMPKEFTGIFKKEQLQSMRYVFKKDSDGNYDLKANTEVILRALQNAGTLMKDPEDQYKGPAYFLYGAASPYQVYKEEDHIRKHFPNAELIEFKDSSHNIHEDFPEKFIDTILQRLQK